MVRQTFAQEKESNCRNAGKTCDTQRLSAYVHSSRKHSVDAKIDGDDDAAKNLILYVENLKTIQNAIKKDPCTRANCFTYHMQHGNMVDRRRLGIVAIAVSCCAAIIAMSR